jgi:hypothetical protein|tara:strand:+ start:2778 stop:3779 length:1002 start_codon:yes stop_codon:yes gene_type:complete
MPKINSYELDGSITGTDKLLGSNGPNGVTRNYKMSAIASYVNSQASAAGLTEEEVQDIVGAMITDNVETNISVTYDDTNGKLNFVSTDTDTNTQLTEEQVQDFVGNMLTGNTETNISVTYDDTNNKINFASVNTQLSQSEVEGIAGGLFTNNPETNITSAFDNQTGKVTLNAVGKEKTVAFGSADLGLNYDNTSFSVILFAAVGSAAYKTKQYNQGALVVDVSAGTIRNSSSSAVDLEINVSALLTTPSGASTVRYLIETADEGDQSGTPGDFSPLPHLTSGISRKRNDAGTHADGFSIAVQLPAAHFLRIKVVGTTSGMTLLEESMYKFSIL